MALADKKDYWLIPLEMHELDLMSARVKAEQASMKKGEEIGVKKALLQVARNLKASGSSTEFIAKQAGLSLKEVDSL